MEISGPIRTPAQPCQDENWRRLGDNFRAAYFGARARLSNYCHLPAVHGDEDDRVQGATIAGGLAVALIAVNF